MAEEQVPQNPKVDDGGTNAVTVAEDDATPVATIASKTADTILDTAQSLLDNMDINDNVNEDENMVGGSDIEERAPNTTVMEHNNTTMLEDSNSNTNPPAGTTVHESTPVIQNNITNFAGVVDVLDQCKCYNNNNNMDHIPLNGKVPVEHLVVQW